MMCMGILLSCKRSFTALILINMALLLAVAQMLVVLRRSYSFSSLGSLTRTEGRTCVSAPNHPLATATLEGAVPCSSLDQEIDTCLLIGYSRHEFDILDHCAKAARAIVQLAAWDDATLKQLALPGVVYRDTLRLVIPLWVPTDKRVCKRDKVRVWDVSSLVSKFPRAEITLALIPQSSSDDISAESVDSTDVYTNAKEYSNVVSVPMRELASWCMHRWGESWVVAYGALAMNQSAWVTDASVEMVQADGVVAELRRGSGATWVHASSASAYEHGMLLPMHQENFDLSSLPCPSPADNDHAILKQLATNFVSLPHHVMWSANTELRTCHSWSKPFAKWHTDRYVPSWQATAASVFVEQKVQYPLRSTLIHQVWTTDNAEAYLPWRKRLLSTLQHHIPNATIWIWSNSLPLQIDVGIYVRRFSWREMTKNTPLEHLQLQGPYAYSHTTDALRLLLLWRYGGVYVDTDVAALRSWEAYMQSSAAFIGLQNDKELNGAILKFPAQHPLLYHLMERLVARYAVRGGDDWTVVGPALWTEEGIAWISRHPEADVRILRPELLYPLPWTEVHSKTLAADVSMSLALHLWNKMMAGPVVMPGSWADRVLVTHSPEFAHAAEMEMGLKLQASGTCGVDALWRRWMYEDGCVQSLYNATCRLERVSAMPALVAAEVWKLLRDVHVDDTMLTPHEVDVDLALSASSASSAKAPGDARSSLTVLLEPNSDEVEMESRGVDGVYEYRYDGSMPVHGWSVQCREARAERRWGLEEELLQLPLGVSAYISVSEACVSVRASRKRLVSTCAHVAGYGLATRLVRDTSTK